MCETLREYWMWRKAGFAVLEKLCSRWMVLPELSLGKVEMAQQRGVTTLKDGPETGCFMLSETDTGERKYVRGLN